MPTLVRRLEQTDLPEYRVVRLEALLRHPEAFLSSYEDEAAESPDSYKRMIAAPPSATFGCFDGDALMGITGLIVSPRAKLRHRGTIVSVYVRPDRRGRGLARQSMKTTIDEARRVGVVSLLLTVTIGDDAAERLYVGLGFPRYGVEERAMRIGDRYFDEAMMFSRLD
jgi:GNAT superfamily N-acetyltransferase